jgi:hypothetical protein
MSATWSAWYQDFFDDTLIGTSTTNATDRAQATAAALTIKARRKRDWFTDGSGGTLYIPPIVLDYKGGNCAEFLDPAILLERYFGSHSSSLQSRFKCSKPCNDRDWRIDNEPRPCWPIGRRRRQPTLCVVSASSGRVKRPSRSIPT